MKIVRTTGRVKYLYYISSDSDLDKKLLTPKVPDNFLTRGKWQDWQVPRFRLYNSITDALSGLYLGQELKGAKLYVYKALCVSNENIITPSITTVPYTLVLDEIWYTGKIRFEKLGEIKVLDKIGTKTYHYGPRSTAAKVFVWDWEEIVPLGKHKSLK